MTLADKLDCRFMAMAITEAKNAGRRGEIPVGAVIVHNGKVIARGRNSKEASFDPMGHAEIMAIRKASKKLKNWRIKNSTIYVTLEPCLMCMGALVQARLHRLVFAAFDPKAGACGTLYDISKDKRLNHRIKVTAGVSEKEAKGLLKNFFLKLRAGGNPLGEPIRKRMGRSGSACTRI